MKLIGKFDWSIVNDSITLRNTDGIAVFTQTKLANGLHKASITGASGEYNYFGDILHDNNNNLIFALLDSDTEILRVVRQKSFMKTGKFDIVSQLGDYSIDINALKTLAVLKNGNDIAMKCSFSGQDYDMFISENENPTLICSIFYGIVLLMNVKD